MRHMGLAVALIVAAMFAMGPAQAGDRMSPLAASAQCKHYGSSDAGTFYFWGECPKAAAAPVARQARRHHG